MWFDELYRPRTCVPNPGTKILGAEEAFPNCGFDGKSPASPGNARAPSRPFRTATQTHRLQSPVVIHLTP